ncbi:hypothetical protein D3C83_334700 [compost metagenome]
MRRSERSAIFLIVDSARTVSTVFSITSNASGVNSVWRRVLMPLSSLVKIAGFVNKT